MVYARTSKEKHFPGTLVLSKKSLEIFDAGRSLDISFAVKMTIKAALLVHILQTLEVLLPGKINYDEPPDDAGDPDSHDPDSEKFSLQGMYSH